MSPNPCATVAFAIVWFRTNLTSSTNETNIYLGVPERRDTHEPISLGHVQRAYKIALPIWVKQKMHLSPSFLPSVFGIPDYHTLFSGDDDGRWFKQNLGSLWECAYTIFPTLDFFASEPYYHRFIVVYLVSYCRTQGGFFLKKFNFFFLGHHEEKKKKIVTVLLLKII